MHSLAAAFLLLFSVLIHIPNNAFGEGVPQYYEEKQIDGCLHESGVYYSPGQTIHDKEKCQVWKCVVRPYHNEGRFEIQQSCPYVRPRAGCRLIRTEIAGTYPDCCPTLICEPKRKRPVVDHYKPTFFVDNIHPHIGGHYTEEIHQPVHHHTSKRIGAPVYVSKQTPVHYVEEVRQPVAHSKRVPVPAVTVSKQTPVHYVEEVHQPITQTKHIGAPVYLSQQPHVVKSVDAYPYAEKTRYG